MAPDTAATTYAEFDNLLRRNRKPVPTRKIANNTYAQRRGPTAIAVMLHETDIVTFHNDGTIALNSGGWLTATTMERMNRYLPSGLRVRSDRGRWMVQTTPEHNVSFNDNIKLAQIHRPGSAEGGPWIVANGLSPIRQEAQDAHNRRIEKLLDSYLRWLTPQRYAMLAPPLNGVMPTTNCGMCVRTDVGILTGDAFEDKQHLIEHLIDKSMPFNVFHVAADHARGDNGIYRAGHYDLARRDLRKYLRGQLYVGYVATKGGKRPAHTPSWTLTARLNRRKSA